MHGKYVCIRIFSTREHLCYRFVSPVSDTPPIITDDKRLMHPSHREKTLDEFMYQVITQENVIVIIITNNLLLFHYIFLKTCTASKKWQMYKLLVFMFLFSLLQ